MRARRTPVLAAITAALALTATTAAVPVGPRGEPSGRHHDPDKRVLKKYAADTWKSFEAMAVPGTGLPADNIAGNLDPATRSGFTSPTNIGAYLWSTAAARDTGLIGKREAKAADGADPRTRSPASSATRTAGCSTTGTTRPPARSCAPSPTSGDTIKPFLSSVDNGWLATGLLLAARAEPLPGQEGRPDPRRT